MAAQRSCIICKRPLTAAEVEEGLVVQAEEGFVCADCVPRMEKELESAATPPPFREEQARPAEGPAAAPAAPKAKKARASSAEAVPVESATPAAPRAPASPDQKSVPSDEVQNRLGEILLELRAISQSLLFERSSIWNVLGGITQVFVFGALAFAVLWWNDYGRDLLTFALLLQVMVLTFFVKGK